MVWTKPQNTVDPFIEAMLWLDSHEWELFYTSFERLELI
jgi:hypothetical protein